LRKSCIIITLLNIFNNFYKVENLLQQQGRSPSTPIAIILWAGTKKQQIWIGTLETIVEQTSEILLSPVVIVIGEVVGLRRN
jgi:uroporphyrin-III C-methyltransferase